MTAQMFISPLAAVAHPVFAAPSTRRRLKLGNPPPAVAEPAASPSPDAAQAPVRSAQGFATSLLADGGIAPHVLVQALALQRRHGGRIEDILLTRGLMDEAALYRALARYWGAPLVDPVADPPDPRMIDTLGAARCLREGLLPWRRVGAWTVVVTAHPDGFDRRMPDLSHRLGPVTMALAPARVIEAAVAAQRGPRLARAAEARVAPGESCRVWAGGGQVPVAVLLGAVVLLALWLAPALLVQGVAAWAALTLVLVTGLKALAALAAWRKAPAEGPGPAIARPPVVSVIVALYREAGIAPRLVRRLERLDYPRDLLDVVLVVEAEDRITRSALAGAALPPWMRVAVVPHGPLRTKPRALNFAMDLCRGSIIGVYDAEDAPEPDQIRKVVERFHARPEKVACLQGVLDFYNPRTNWMSRCFAIEYASWFRVVLPGIARLGLPVPLGGTTLFFRRAVLEELGGWDAWNVTEDADLGVRLTRHGYRTELIDTVTEEEACCRPLPWVKQRSRWIKGYMMTWAVHMRRPMALWRDLGPRGFVGFQVLFAASLSQFLLAPVLWSFWLIPFGVPHPVAAAMGPWAFWGLMALFLATEAVNLAVAWCGITRTKHRLTPLWLPLLHVYFPLGTFASYKAAWEMVVRPFYWDKTSHGHFDQSADAAPPQRVLTSPASMRRRVS